MNDTRRQSCCCPSQRRTAGSGGPASWPCRKPAAAQNRLFARARRLGLLSVTGFPNGLEACRSGLWLLSGPAKGSGLRGPALADMDFRTRASSNLPGLTSWQNREHGLRRMPGQTYRPRPRAMISFWISVVPPKSCRVSDVTACRRDRHRCRCCLWFARSPAQMGGRFPERHRGRVEARHRPDDGRYDGLSGFVVVDAAPPWVTVTVPASGVTLAVATVPATTPLTSSRTAGGVAASARSACRAAR